MFAVGQTNELQDDSQQGPPTASSAAAASSLSVSSHLQHRLPYISVDSAGVSSWQSSPADPPTNPSSSQPITANAEAGPSRLSEDPTSAEGDKPKIRASRACSSCNRQKLRCDGAQPCARCISSNIESTCAYLPSLRGKTRKRKEKPDKGKGRLGKRQKSDTAAGHDHSRGTQVTNSTTPVQSHLPDELQRRTSGLDENQEYQMWKRDGALATTGARNSTLWGEPPPIPLQQNHRTSSLSQSSPGRPGFSPSNNTHSALDKLTTLPLPGDAHNPLAVLAEASATAHSDHDPNSPMNVPVAKKDEAGYYAPLERVLKDEAPHIMSLINVHEAEQLFDMYFKYLHPYLPFLDREHSSPSAVARRNNFLFNAICCVAARAFNVVLWERLKEFTRYEMERLPKEKNIDVVQGHLIYAQWNLIRPKHFEQDMSWLRVGVAVRTAIDINLHRVALLRQAREGLPGWLLRSIVRTWLLSYIIDRTLSAQLGKPSSMRGENSVRTYIEILTKGDEEPTVDDIWVGGLAEWTQILARAMDVFRNFLPSGDDSKGLSMGNENTLPDLVHVFDKQFRQWRDRSEEAAKACKGIQDRDLKSMIGTIRLYDHYARLVVQSFGLQRALEAPSDLPAAFIEYLSAAYRLITSFETDLESVGLIRGSPDFVFTVLTYAAVSLLKALQPQFAHLDPNRESMLSASRKAADMLARSAMTSDHIPASQSVFLTRLIDVKTNERPTPSAVPQPIPDSLDFEAFGQAIDNDQSRTLWPPLPSPTAFNDWANLDFGTRAAQPSSSNWDPAATQSNGNINMTNQTAQVGANQAMDLSSWVAQNASFSVPLPGAALGLGMGSFQGDGDWMFNNQDAFWKSLLDGPSHPPSLV